MASLATLPLSPCASASTSYIDGCKLSRQSLHAPIAVRCPWVSCNSRNWRLSATKGKKAVKKARPRPSRNFSVETPQEELYDDASAEAALEALFTQLEKDFEDGELSDDDDEDEFTEEEVLAFGEQLEAALLGVGLHTDSRKSIPSRDDDIILDADIEDDDEQRVVSLENWQLKKLAAAAELGRRRVNVKTLAAELGMDRADVLAWLKDPPPDLLMLGASMNDENDPGVSYHSEKDTELTKVTTDLSKDVKDTELTSTSWYSKKRLRKEQTATLERVYRRTKRPTNAMIQSIVELTHLPRKTIIEWFEEKRNQARSFDSLR